MQDSTVGMRGARYTGLIALVLAASLVTALAALLFATKYAEAQDSQTITLEPAEVGFGAVTLDANTQTRTVTITNNGQTELVIGGIDFSGLGLEPGTFTTSLDTERLVLGAGETGTFQVNFDPVTSGFKEATGTLLNASGLAIEGAPQVAVSGTGVTTQPNTQPGVQRDCTIIGTRRGEVLTGTRRDDVICALGGRDRVNGLKGNDKLRGGAKEDRLTDKAGFDRLFGQGGRDTLITRDGERGDRLNGGPGRDRAIKDSLDRARSI